MTVEINWDGQRNSGTDKRSWLNAMFRGARLKCPQCGVGSVFASYLKVDHTCPHCGEELHHHRADDAPPYFTIFIVGHIIIGPLLFLEREYAPPLYVHAVIWLPAIIILSLALLPVVKGAVVGLQWALRMHGFSGTPDPMDDQTDQERANHER